jgi:hypothetical protein
MLFKAGGDDTGWLSNNTASCASTTSILKSDIIEVWKRRKKKNHKEEAWKRCKKKKAAAEVRPTKDGPATAKANPPAKAGLTLAKAGLHKPALFWP